MAPHPRPPDQSHPRWGPLGHTTCDMRGTELSHLELSEQRTSFCSFFCRRVGFMLNLLFLVLAHVCAVADLKRLAVWLSSRFVRRDAPTNDMPFKKEQDQLGTLSLATPFFNSWAAKPTNFRTCCEGSTAVWFLVTDKCEAEPKRGRSHHSLLSPSQQNLRRFQDC